MERLRRRRSRRVNSVLLRRSYREGAKVKHETLANLAALPEHAVESLRAPGPARLSSSTGAPDRHRSTTHRHPHSVARTPHTKNAGIPAHTGIPAFQPA
ncbi:hypothetical protein [Arthrobacter methylotrophus]|uniref:hypothetical protein n=1 Tax=Arthrobacter methylotrophus TaxID=121291 RepID=UPI0031E54BC7